MAGKQRRKPTDHVANPCSDLTDSFLTPKYIRDQIGFQKEDGGLIFFGSQPFPHPIRQFRFRHRVAMIGISVKTESSADYIGISVKTESSADYIERRSRSHNRTRRGRVEFSDW